MDAGSISTDRRCDSKCGENSPTIVSAACRYKAQPAIPAPETLLTRKLIRRNLRNRTYRRPADTTEGTGRALEKLAAQISTSILAARRYGGSCDITLDLSIMDTLTNRSGMDTSSVEAFTRNGPSGRWTITHGRIVAVTLVGLYFAGQGRVVAVTCRDPILVRIVLLESSPTIEGIKLPFSERGLELLSDCVGEEFTWEAKYLRPYASMISDVDFGIGGPPIPVLEDSKPIEQFLP